MTRYHTKVVRNADGVQTGQENVPFTQAEEDKQDAKEEAILAAKPMQDWENQKREADKLMPDWFEDAIDEGSIILKPGRVKNNYDAKKVLRGNRP